MMENSNEKNMPIGFAFSLALNDKAMKFYAGLTKDIQEQIENYIKTSPSGEEAKQRIEHVVKELSNENMSFIQK